MKGSTVLSIPALVIAVWLPSPARACGEKIVDISRGVRFQRACAIRPASVLLVPGAGSGALDRLGVNLSRVGHSVQFARTAESLRQLLQSKAFDLVIAPAGEADEVTAALRSARSSPLLIPALSSGGPAELAAARRTHGFAVSLVEDAKSQLLTIDEAMKTRSAADAAARTSAGSGR